MSDDHHVVAMDLVPSDEGRWLDTQSVSNAAVILLNGRGRISHAPAEIQCRERRLADAAQARETRHGSGLNRPTMPQIDSKPGRCPGVAAKLLSSRKRFWSTHIQTSEVLETSEVSRVVYHKAGTLAKRAGQQGDCVDGL